MDLKKGIYKHYKGKKYLVIDVVTHSETLEIMVLYQQMYGDKSLWVRPIQMFFEKVIVDGNDVARFEFINQ
jgi:hypothetical protein